MNLGWSVAVTAGDRARSSWETLKGAAVQVQGGGQGWQQGEACRDKGSSQVGIDTEYKPGFLHFLLGLSLSSHGKLGTREPLTPCP